MKLKKFSGHVYLIFGKPEFMSDCIWIRTHWRINKIVLKEKVTDTWVMHLVSKKKSWCKLERSVTFPWFINVLLTFILKGLNEGVTNCKYVPQQLLMLLEYALLKTLLLLAFFVDYRPPYFCLSLIVVSSVSLCPSCSMSRIIPSLNLFDITSFFVSCEFISPRISMLAHVPPISPILLLFEGDQYQDHYTN